MRNMFNPKVSIVIPVFNGGNFLGQAIDSALAQTYRNIEILVINDGSNDSGETDRIALSYGDRIRYYKKANGGVATALNMAIEKMSGEYFSWLSHDDLYFSDKVSSQVQALAGMADYDRVVLYGNFAVFFDGAVNTVSEVHLPSTPYEIFRYYITTRNNLHGCTLLIPKRAFGDCGCFDEALRTTQDYDLWFRMADKYRFVHMQKMLVKSRAHGNQGSVVMKDTAAVEINALLSGFVINLSEEEIVIAARKPIGLAYAEIYMNFLGRGFTEAANVAQKLMWQHGVKQSFVDEFRKLLLLAGVRAKIILRFGRRVFFGIYRR